MSSSQLRRPWRALAGLLLVVPALGGPHVDQVHSLMEPPPPKVERPRVSSPVVASPRLQRPGLAGLAMQLASPARTLLLLPAAFVALYACFPEQMARLALHVLCFFGSLFEPFDTVLPPKHPLRFFVRHVQHARRQYEVKHGLEGLRSPMQFFDEADDVEDDDGEEEEGDGEAGEEGADGAATEADTGAKTEEVADEAEPGEDAGGRSLK